MTDLLTQSGKLPGVELATTIDEFKTVATDTLECKEKVIYYLGSTDILRCIYTQEYDQGFYIPSRVDLGIKVKMLSPDTPMMRSYQATDANEDRETRCLPEGMEMNYSVMVYDDKVVYFIEEDQLTALTITSAPIAETMKQVFEGLWRTAA